MMKIILLLLSLTVFIFSKDNQAKVLVLNKTAGTLSIFDAGTLEILGTIRVGNFPHELAVSEDGKLAFVANYGQQTPGSTISIVDIKRQKELRKLDISPLMRPHGIQVVKEMLYFTAESNRSIARYNIKKDKIDWMMGTGYSGSHMIAVSGDQKRFYTTNVPANNITVIELTGIPPAKSKITHIDVGRQPEAIDLSPAGDELWVGLNLDASIDIIRTGENKLVKQVSVGDRPYRVKFTPNGKYVLASIPAKKEILLISVRNKTVLKRLKLESIPLGIIISKDSNYAFVTAVQEDYIIKVDLINFKIINKAKTGLGPDGVALSGM